MTENKRFVHVFITDLGVNAIYDNNTGKHIPLSDRIAEKLNELNDENKELKAQLSEFDFLKDENKHMRKVLEENKELKELITDKNKTQLKTLKQLTKTQKELQTLKNTIKDMYNTERTHIGHNVLAQLIETIQ